MNRQVDNVPGYTYPLVKKLINQEFLCHQFLYMVYSIKYILSLVINFMKWLSLKAYRETCICCNS